MNQCGVVAKLRSSAIACAMVLGAFSTTSATAQQCQPYWDGVAIYPNPQSPFVKDMKVFDDGTGAAVYMASNADLVAPSWRWQRGRWQNISQGAGQYALALGVTSAFGALTLLLAACGAASAPPRSTSRASEASGPPS